MSQMASVFLIETFSIIKLCWINLKIHLWIIGIRTVFKKYFIFLKLAHEIFFNKFYNLKKFNKKISLFTLSLYIAFLTIAIFHHHVYDLGTLAVVSDLINSSTNSVKDPFLDDQANCSFQISIKAQVYLLFCH